MRQVVVMSAVLSAAVALIPITGTGADWPNWRGPDHNGISSETTTWSPAAISGIPRIVWESNVGIGYSSVAVSDGRLYTIGNRELGSGDDARAVDTIYCLDATTGKELWRYTYPCPKGDTSFTGSKATPAVDDGWVYSLSDSGHLVCLNAKTGSVRWRVDVISAHGIQREHFGLSGSPYIEGDLVLLNLGSGGLAVDKHSGKAVWNSPPGPCSFSTPVVFENAEKKIALFSAKKFQIVDVATGASEGSVPWDTSAEENSADPIVDGKRIFISSAYGMGSALLEVVKTGLEVVWQNKEMNNVFTSSVLIDGHLYGYDGTTRRCTLKCIDFDTGKRKWQQKLDFGSLIAADGKLIILTQKGTLRIADATPEGYREINSARVLRVPENAPSQRGKVWWSAPVLVDGLLYARSHAGDLVCIDMRPRA